MTTTMTQNPAAFAIDKLKQRERDAKVKYAEILDRLDNPEPGDGEALLDAAAILKIDADTLATHRGVVQRAKALQSLFWKNGELAQYQSQSNELVAAFHTANTEKSKAIRRFEDAEIAIRQNGFAEEKRRKEDENARNTIDKLEEQYPLVFGITRQA